MTSDAKSTAAASIERNCKWNPIEDDSGRQCSTELRREEDICVNCAAVRDRWLARLIAEDGGKRSRSTILAILDNHRSLVVAREAISAGVRVAPRSFSSPPKPAVSRPQQIPPHSPAKDGPPAGSNRRSAPGNRVEVREIASAVAALLPSSPARCDEVDKEEESWQRKRMEKQDERRSRANEERAERRTLLASRRASEEDAEPAIPVPKPFIVLREATAKPSTCSALERVQGEESWGWGEAISKCWKCGCDQRAARENAVPLIIGGRDHLMRAEALSRYKCVVCVPVLHCCEKRCKVGCLRTITSVLWGDSWVALEGFLRWDEASDGPASAGFMMGMGRGNEMIEIESGLNRGRAIVHLLHWFSRGHENRADDHAGLPPPGISRPCAIVLRDSVACGYSTFTRDTEFSENGGLKLPTLYNIFVRSSHRYRGCARQLLCTFFRFQEAGKYRFRFRLASSQSASGTGAVLEEEKVCSLSHESLPFYDKLQIDPPVSPALVSTMRRIFSPSELDNIVHDVGDVDSGCITYMINPCEPKVRMFQVHANAWIKQIADVKTGDGGERNVGRRAIVIGGIREGAA